MGATGYATDRHDGAAADGRALLVDVAVTMHDRFDELTERLLDRADQELAKLSPVARLELGQPLKRGATAAIRDAVDRLVTYRPPPLELPGDTHAAAGLWARAGLEVSALVSVCSLNRAEFWEMFADITALLASGPTDALLAHTLAQRSLSLHSDRLADLLRAVCESERKREAPAQQLAARRAALIRAALSGETPSSTELGYELRQHHLAVVLSGDAAQPVAAAMARSAGRRLLTGPGPDGALWAWFGGPSPFTADDVSALLAPLAEGDLRAAVGEPGFDAPGFRLSHRQAVTAVAGSPTGGAVVTRYGDVSMLVLLGRVDPAASRGFVEFELGGLLGADPRSVDLRLTLAVHLAQGQRTSATGTSLGIDRHTVRERLDEVERRIGRSIQSRSAELHTALMLLRVHPALVVAGAPAAAPASGG
jgi:GGDEF-like domain/PucR C-terminal helix-turn-helix domain